MITNYIKLSDVLFLVVGIKTLFIGANLPYLLQVVYYGVLIYWAIVKIKDLKEKRNETKQTNSGTKSDSRAVRCDVCRGNSCKKENNEEPRTI